MPNTRQLLVTATALSIVLSCAHCAYEGEPAATDQNQAAPIALPKNTTWADFDALAGTEKIRNGTWIGFDTGWGNSSVMILTQHGNSTCTAQVINKYFLLTAAHCIADLYPGGSDWTLITFTDTNNNSLQLPVVAAGGVQIDNWRPGDNDIGLVFIPSGFDTCQSSFNDCYDNRKNVPANAIFQVYFPGFEATASNYVIVGYGTPDDSTAELHQKLGATSVVLSQFTDDQHIGHKIITEWTDDSQTRTCQGDSGSALVTGDFAKLLHTGVLSRGGPCVNSDGTSAYSGLSNEQAQWLLNTMAELLPDANPAYHCTMATATVSNGNLLAFGCDNDGTFYP